MVYNKDQIKSFLPHREPFLFIDSIESLEYPCEDNFTEDKLPSIKDLVGATLHAKFCVEHDLEILRGHFPGNPVMPGVIQIEVMAQAAALTITKLFARPFDTKINFILGSVNNSKFRKPIRPGDELDIYTEFKQARGNMMTYFGRIENNGQICSEATFMALMELL